MDTTTDEPILGPNRGNAGKGRPKGALNKTTVAAKDAIAQAADELGGTARLVEWVKEDPANEKVFWGTIYPKLLPLQVSGEGGGAVPISGEVTFRIVRPDADRPD